MIVRSARASRHSTHLSRVAAATCLTAVLLAGCTASSEPSDGIASNASTLIQTDGSLGSLRLSPTPNVSPASTWTSITWAASDPAPFSGPGNQYVFGGVPWSSGSVLVGEEAPLPSGNVEGVVWSSPDNAHWQRIPNTGGTFSGAEIEAVAATGSTLVAVGDSRLEDSATTLTPPIGIAWVSSDGTHWQRSPDDTAILGDIVVHGVAAGPSGFVAYGNGLGGGAALAFSTDGFHWKREGADALFADSNVAAITWTGRGFAAVGSRNVAQPSGVISQAPGPAAAWWSSDGQEWHQSDAGSTGYALESVQPWINSLRAIGIPPCFGCISPPAEWRSTDDGRTWRPLPPPPTPNFTGSTAVLAGGRAVSLQDQPPQVTWTADGQIWKVLHVGGSPIPDSAQLVVGADQTVIAMANVTVGRPNDQVDMRVFAGQLH